MMRSETCCETGERRRLIVIGGGSAAFAAVARAASRGWRATIVNGGLPIGGTCVNVGCVPSKTLIRAAEARRQAAAHGFAGVATSAGATDFGKLARQTEALVRQLRQERYLDVAEALDGVEIVEGRARFVSPGAVEIDGRAMEGDRILIATGARTFVPDAPGLAESGYLVPDTAFALERLPESLVILGGRYVALECAQMFARLGSKVTVLQRSERILPTESPVLTEALAAILREEGIDVRTGARLRRVRREAGGVRVDVAEGGALQAFAAERLLLAAGRTPNTEDLGLERAGVARGPDGFVAVDECLRTSAPGIYAAGDVIGAPMHVYTTAYEGALAADNACGGERRRRDYDPLPQVVFTDPQVAGVGFDEAGAKAAGFDAESVTLPMAKVPRCLAARQTQGFLQLTRDRGTDRILGARALAREGSELMMEIALAIRNRMTAAELADMFHPYLTLGEAVKLAALAFRADIDKLSCCAT